MPSELTSRSHSGVQTAAEVEILERLGGTLGLVVQHSPARIDVGSAHINVDGSADGGRVLIEAYARQGKLRGAQLKKVAQDILKFAVLKRQPGKENVRTIIAFASPEAQKSIAGWVKEAAATFNVELLVVDVGEDLRQTILAAQARQIMVNKVDDVLDGER